MSPTSQSASEGLGLEAAFLDSDPPDPGEEHSPETCANRPWRRYWPPIAGSALHSWLAVECPAALSWRFDSKEPFDRPWQKWTQDARKSGRFCPSKVLPATELRSSLATKVDKTNTIEDHSSDPEEESIWNQQQWNMAADLDRTISEWGLRSVTARSFHYLAPQLVYAVEKPFHSRLPFLNGLRRTNIVGQAYDNVRIHDVTGSEDQFTLSESGFKFLSIPISMLTWDVESARNVYLPFIEAWLKDFFGSDLVHIYTYNFRSLDKNRIPPEIWLGPFARAHCDVTKKSSRSRLRLHFPNSAVDIEKGRYRFIGIWRPLSGPYQDSALAVCDSRTVSHNDLVPADVVFPHYCDEGYEVKHNESHRWFYKRGMTTDDVILLKHFDSDYSEASFCPHSAFTDDTVPADTPIRASIEIRAIVVGGNRQ